MKETYIHPTAIIYPNVTIGEGCYIGPYCVIGGPPEHADIDPLTCENGGVYIGSECRLYGHVTIDGGMVGTTQISPRCIFMKGSHVGHDATIWSDCTISCGAKIGGHSTILNKSNIGLNATLHQFTVLTVGTMVGAGAFVKGKHVEKWRILAGVPARDIGENKVGRARWNQ
jgi:UDP-N-acetylglucosamine acyltransferase